MEEILNKYKEFLIARGLSLNYYNIIKIFLSYLETKKIEPENITQEIITDFFNSNSYSISTKNQFIKAGRNFFIFLESNNKEWNKFKLMKTERKIPDYLTEEEIEKAISFIITYHSKRMTSIKIRALIHFLFYSGVRKAEILNLKRDSFNFEDNIAKVYGKGKKERIICFPKKVAKEIQDYFASEPEKNNCFNVSLGIINYLPKLISKHLNKKVYPHLFRHCVSADTQVFTKEGWKKYNEIDKNNKILTYNIKKNILEYKSLINIYKYHINEKINHLNFMGIDSLFTKEHNLLIQKWNWKKKKNQWSIPLLETIKKVSNPFRFIVSAKIKNTKNLIGIHKAFILGILMADGNISYHQTKYQSKDGTQYYNNRGIIISQSWSANKDKCKIIRDHLIKANIIFSEKLSKEIIGTYGKVYQMKTFRLYKNSQDWIFNWLNKNKMPKKEIYKLSKSELEYIFKGLILGDGCKQNYNCIEFRGQEPEIIEMLQTICCLLGYRSTLSKDDRGYFRLYICKRNYYQINKNNLKTNLKLVNYNGIVWCPQTKNLTFLAKRNNSIFLTGNSFARNLIYNKGVDINTVSKLLGHSSISTTMIYINPDEKAIKNNYKKLVG